MEARTGALPWRGLPPRVARAASPVACPPSALWPCLERDADRGWDARAARPGRRTPDRRSGRTPRRAQARARLRLPSRARLARTARPRSGRDPLVVPAVPSQCPAEAPARAPRRAGTPTPTRPRARAWRLESRRYAPGSTSRPRRRARRHPPPPAPPATRLRPHARPPARAGAPAQQVLPDGRRRAARPMPTEVRWSARRATQASPWTEQPPRVLRVRT